MGGENNIQVMVRCRPLNSKEVKEGAKDCIELDEFNPTNIYIGNKNDQKKFQFDFVGGKNTTQEDIFRIAGKPLTLATLEGYNSCIFAYGQTGAGKTFTMQGRGLETEGNDSPLRGLQPRVFDFLFGLTNQEIKESNGSVEYLITCSYLEIYNEQIMDLLSHTNANLLVREDLKKGVYIEGLSELPVCNSNETIEMLRKGMRNRHVGATNMNADSSRSHSVFSMTIESKKSRDGCTNVTSSKLHFVDLAGSERQKQTAAAGDRLKEANNINKSLTTLGLVINSLVEIANGKQRHIPYRDSKLTFLLKDSLGGNSRTYMIAAVSMANTSFQETMSTLKFAQRAKMIKNKASINEEASGNVESLKKEIKRLKEEILGQKSLIEELQQENENKVNKEEEQQMLSGKKSKSHADNFAVECFSKEIQEMNGKYLDTESIFMEQIEQLTFQLEETQGEMISKDYDLLGYKIMYQQVQQQYQQNEMQYKSIIYLYQARIDRYFNFMANIQMITQDNDKQMLIQQFYQGDYRDLYEQIQKFVNMLQNIDGLMQISEDYQNYDYQRGELISTMNESLLKLQEVKSKVQESVEERKILDNIIERQNLFKLPTPEKVQAYDEKMNKQKIEFTNQLDKMSEQIQKLKDRENNQSKQIENQFKKNKKMEQEYKEEIERIKQENKNDSEAYEQRIDKMVQEFQNIENQKVKKSSDLEKEIRQLKIQKIESDKNIQQLEKHNHDLTVQLQKLESSSKQIQQENQQMIEASEESYKELEEQLEKLQKEKEMVDSQMIVLKDELKEFQKSDEERKQINAQLLQEKNNMKQNIEQLIEEKKHLNNEIEKIQSENQSELLKRQNKIDSLIEEQNDIEMEKNKIQEQYETMNDTMQFQQEELEEKRQIVNDYKEVKEKYEEQIQLLEEKVEKMQREGEEMTQNLIEQSGEQIAAKKNKELENQNHEYKIQLENECKSNMILRSQMNELNTKHNEIKQSEDHFRTAYLEIKNQLQGYIQQSKELQQTLAQKEMDYFELQRDIKSSNDNVYFLQERIYQLKEENQTQKAIALRGDDNTNKFKEKNIQLSTTLQLKIDEVKQQIDKNGELKKELVAIKRENDLLKAKGQSQLSVNEKQLQEIMVNYATQGRENKTLQQTLNNKIQENITLAATTSSLQTIIEKQSRTYAEDRTKHQQEIAYIKEENQKYISRIDLLIEDISLLEGQLIDLQEDYNELQQNGGGYQNNMSYKQEKALQETIQQQNNKIMSLQQKIDELQKDKQSLKENYKKKKEYSQMLEQKYENLKHRAKDFGIAQTPLKELNTNNNNSNKDYQQLDVQMQNEKMKNTKLQNENHKLQETIQQNKKEKSELQIKIADLNKIIFQNDKENFSNGNQQQNNSIESYVCSIAGLVKKGFQQKARTQLKNLPTFKENDFTESLAFIQPAAEKFFEILAEKDAKLNNYMKEIDLKEMQVSKLEKEKMAISKNLGLSQSQINGFTTPRSKMGSQESSVNTSFNLNQQNNSKQNNGNNNNHNSNNSNNNNNNNNSLNQQLQQQQQQIQQLKMQQQQQEQFTMPNSSVKKFSMQKQSFQKQMMLMQNQNLNNNSKDKISMQKASMSKNFQQLRKLQNCFDQIVLFYKFFIIIFYCYYIFQFFLLQQLLQTDIKNQQNIIFLYQKFFGKSKIGNNYNSKLKCNSKIKVIVIINFNNKYNNINNNKQLEDLL